MWVNIRHNSDHEARALRSRSRREFRQATLELCKDIERLSTLTEDKLTIELKEFMWTLEVLDDVVKLNSTPVSSSEVRFNKENGYSGAVACQLAHQQTYKISLSAQRTAIDFAIAVAAPVVDEQGQRVGGLCIRAINAFMTKCLSPPSSDQHKRGGSNRYFNLNTPTSKDPRCLQSVKDAYRNATVSALFVQPGHLLSFRNSASGSLMNVNTTAATFLWST